MAAVLKMAARYAEFKNLLPTFAIMSTEESIPDVSQESNTANNVDVSENNEITSPVETSTTTTEANPNGTTEEASNVSEEAPASPSKPKASVTTEAKKVIKSVVGSVKAGPTNAVKKVCFFSLSLLFAHFQSYNVI